MSEYAYQAIDIKGEEVKGVISAPSKEDAALRLVRAGFFVSKLEKKEKNLLNYSLFSHKDPKYLAIFFRQLSILVNSGLSLYEGLKIIATQDVPKTYQVVILDLSHLIETGICLSKALEKYPSYFSPEISALVYAGEVSGTLDVVLERLAKHLEKIYQIREKTLTILFYPFILLITTLCVLVFVISYVLPTFSLLFSSLKTDLPIPTRVLLFLSQVWQDLSFTSLFLLLSFAIVFFFFLFFFPYGARFKIYFAKYILHFPLLGKILRYSEIMRFTSTLSLLLKSGIVIDKALVIVQRLAQNPYIAELLQKATIEVKKGYQLSKVFEKSFFLDTLFLVLLKVGERTGELDFVLNKIADFSHLELDTLTTRIQVSLEPLLILVLGIVIGFIVLAIALPILDSIQFFM